MNTNSGADMGLIGRAVTLIYLYLLLSSSHNISTPSIQIFSHNVSTYAVLWAPHTLIPLTPQGKPWPGREKKSPIASSPSPASPVATTSPPSVPPWKRRVMESAGAGELSGTGGRFLMRTRRCHRQQICKR